VSAAKYISWFHDIGLADRPKVGGKGGSLGELHRAGIDVPPGFVVRTEAFEAFIDVLERRSPLRARVEGLAAGELEGMGTVSRELRARIEEVPLPEDLQREIRDSYEGLGKPGGRRRSRCGRRRPPKTPRMRASPAFRTLISGHPCGFIDRQDTQLLGKPVFAGVAELSAAAGYAESTVAMAVVVQIMVDARTAGSCSRAVPSAAIDP